MKTSQKFVWLFAAIIVALVASLSAIALSTKEAFDYKRYWGMRLTEVPGKFTCPRLHNSPQCAAVFEKRFLARYPRVATRENDVLKVALLDGNHITIQEDEGSSLPMELVNNARFLIITHFFFEGIAWRYVDRENGKTFVTGGYPLFSPDYKHFVSARRSGFESAEFNVYRMTSNGPAVAYRENFSVTPWEPTHVEWRDNNTIQFVMSEAVPDDHLGSIERRTWAALKQIDGRWLVQRLE